MRELSSEVITEAVAELCIEANKILPCSLKEKLEAGMKSERDELPKKLCEDILRNLDAAKELDIPICQDTGMAVVFVEIGQDRCAGRTGRYNSCSQRFRKRKHERTSDVHSRRRC